MGQGQSGANYDGTAWGEAGDDATTMKAWILESPGKITDMKQADVYLPKPERGEIRVHVMCVGLNPVDYKRCSNHEADFPCILGSDVAGVVDEIGADVTNFQVGERVYFHCNVRRQYGAFAEYTITSAASTAPIPEGLSFAEAAAVPCSGWTAYIALYYKLKVQAGQTILITGAAGGVGCFAVQLAKLSGLAVIAHTAAYKQGFVKALGADHVLDSAQAEADTLQTILELTNGQLVDHLLDTVGSKSATTALKYCKLNGNVCSLAGPVNGPELFDRGLSLHYVNIGGMHQAPADDAKLLLGKVGRDMGKLFTAKQLRVPIAEECRFEQIPAALATLKTGRVQGKLVANVVDCHKRRPKKLQAGVDTAVPVPAVHTAPVANPLPPVPAPVQNPVAPGASPAPTKRGWFGL